MTNQAQIDAIEHLLIAVLNSSISNGVPKGDLINKAKTSLLGSEGPGGTEQKSAAVEYVNYISSKLR